MKIKNKQSGFVHIAVLVLIAALIVIGIVCWRMWKHSSGAVTINDTTKSTSSQKADANIITLTLVNKATGKAVSDTKVHISSDNGIVCIQSPCPANGKTWDGITNENGEILISKDFVQVNTNVTPEGFKVKTIHYKDGQSTYRVEF